MNAATRHAAAAATPEFTFTVPDRAMFSIRQLIGLTGMDRTFLEEWFEEKCHAFRSPKASRPRKGKGAKLDAQGKPLPPQGQRPTLRVPRLFVIELLVQSARYDQASKVYAVEGLAAEFSPTELRHLAAHYLRTADAKEKETRA